MSKLYVQYGCGLSAPKEWTNFDVSPTLRLQKIPVLGALSPTKWPKNVKYGDIIAGLPIADDSCDGLYCSHTLEHLSLNDFRIALKNSFKVLKKGGIFRIVLPDIESMARSYIDSLDKGNKTASINFINNTLMGVEQRKRGLKGLISSYYGNSHHLWMWDHHSLSEELKKAGFSQIRNAKFNDSEDAMFKLVEDESRFENAVAIECRK
jgi:ubiquinone/menaquinone biosynthesis C-methylase UbiE